MLNKIELEVQNGVWICNFYGPHAVDVVALFGTNAIPTPFTSAANRGEVLMTVQGRNPDAFVTFARAVAA